jgi:hypothetical protein
MDQDACHKVFFINIIALCRSGEGFSKMLCAISRKDGRYALAMPYRFIRWLAGDGSASPSSALQQGIG